MNKLKYLLLTSLVIVLHSTVVTAQSKKEIKKFGIKSVTVVDEENGKTVNDSKSTYDNNGEPVEEINYNKEGGIKTIHKYKRNKEGDVIEETEYDAANNLKEKKVVQYNALGEKVEEAFYDKNGQLIRKHTYLYNAKGLRTEKRTFDAHGKMVSVRKYVYQFN